MKLVPWICAPVDNLLCNWAYMVMVNVAWNLKSWAALLIPETSTDDGIQDVFIYIHTRPMSDRSTREKDNASTFELHRLHTSVLSLVRRAKS